MLLIQKKIEGLAKYEIENRLKHMYSVTQIAAILDGRKVNKWSDDDLAEAFTLRSFSSKCYEYLRTKISSMKKPKIFLVSLEYYPMFCQ